MKFYNVVSIQVSLSLDLTQPPYGTRYFLKQCGFDCLCSTTVWNEKYLWHGCIFFNVLMTHITLGQPRILICAFHNIKAVKVQDIRLEDCQFNWFIVKSMIVSLTRFIERNKSKAGLGASAKP